MLLKLLIYFILLTQPLLAQSNKIELFWRILIKDYHFGYTIFGNKPMCSHQYYLDNSLCINASANSDPMLSTLWRLWEENYTSLNKNFCMKKVQHCDEGILYEEFYIINKEKCLNVIRENFSDFKIYFKNLNSPNEILEEICNQGPHIVKNHRLTGILLGYGEFNARKFQKQFDYFDQLSTYIGLQNK